MQGSIKVWPTNKTKFEVTIATAAGNLLAVPLVEQSNHIIQAIDREFQDIVKQKHLDPG